MKTIAILSTLIIITLFLSGYVLKTKTDNSDLERINGSSC